MNIINIGILAHVDAGKTTLTESILYFTGVINKKGRVDTGTTISDSMELERERGMSIKSSTVSFTYNNIKINLIDTPGHMDFIAEVERSLSVLDLVVLVISAKEGIQPQTRVIFNKLKELKIPTILFINKVDRIGVDMKSLYKNIAKQLSKQTIRMQEVIGCGNKEFVLREENMTHSSLVEQLIVFREDLFYEYVNDNKIDARKCFELYRALVKEGSLYPIYHGSALLDMGIKSLLDSIVMVFFDETNSIRFVDRNATIYQSNINNSVSNLEYEISYDIILKNNSSNNNSSNNNELLSAYVYKIEWDQRNHKKIYVRLFKGSLFVRQKVMVYGKEESITITSIRCVRDGRVLPTDHLVTGDIGILLDIDGLSCGDYLGDKYLDASYELAKPLLRISVCPKIMEERAKLIHALKQLEVEDPFLEMIILKETKEIQLKLFGSLQMDVLTNLLLTRYQLEVYFKDVITIYKEQPSKTCKASIWIGDPNNFYHAGVVLEIEPLELGSGFHYENRVSYGYLEKSFQNAVLEGIKIGLQEGIHNCEIIDVNVTFLDAYYDSVCGTPADFRKLTPLVVKKALEGVELIVLKPWQYFTLSAPTGYEKMIMNDLFKMGGQVEKVSYEDDEFSIIGIIPYESSKDYSLTLLTLSEGKGMFQTRFYRFLP